MDNETDQGPSLADYLDDEPTEATVEAPEPDETETAEATAERERDERGRFAKKGEEGGSPPPDDKELDHPALLGERRRRQEAEQRLSALEAQLKQQQQPPAEAPDIFADPEGFQQHLAATVDGAVYRTTFTMSDRFARQAYGDEAVNEASQWAYERCAQDRAFNEQVRQSGDPVRFAVEAYQREQMYREVTPETFAEFKAWKAGQTAPPAQKPALPPTLTTERSAGPPGRNDAPAAGFSLSDFLT